MARPSQQQPLTPSPSLSRQLSTTTSNMSSPTPQPLRIFKRTSRTFSLQQHLAAPDASPPPLSTMKEPQPQPPSFLRHISFSSIDCQISPADPYVGGNSSLTLLPTPPASDTSDDSDDDDDDGNENVEDDDDDEALHDDETDDRVPLVRKPTPSTTPGTMGPPPPPPFVATPTIGLLKRKASNLPAAAAAAKAPLNNNNNNKGGGGTTTFHRCCSMCKNPLQSALKTYAFPRTAPTVLTALRSIYPDLEMPVDGDGLLLSSSSSNKPPPTPIRTTTIGQRYGINRRALTPIPSTSPACNNNNNGSITTSHQIAPSHTAMGGDVAAPSSLLGLGLPRQRSPEFCLSCFEQLHALHICWTCGERVERAEERVGCGWAWWHWGCMACLLCRAPIAPPAWTAYPITLSEPPACRACLRELRELVAIERRKISDCRRRCYSPVPVAVSADDVAAAAGGGGGVGGVDMVLSSSGSPSATVPLAVMSAVAAASAPYYPRRLALPTAATAVSAVSSLKTGMAEGKGDEVVDDDDKDEGSDVTMRGRSTIRPTIGASQGRVFGGSGRNGTMWGSGGVVSGGVEGMGMGKAKRYPPLPKWMDKLPGRRGGGGGMMVGASGSSSLPTTSMAATTGLVSGGNLL